MWYFIAFALGGLLLGGKKSKLRKLTKKELRELGRSVSTSSSVSISPSVKQTKL